jgi:ABC-type transporter Mla subunit MlaD
MPKNVIEFTVITNDNGSTKIVASSMDKLSAEIDSAATKTDKLKKKTGELDRNLKGTAGITSNTTKGFAKMSQGMGGLVSVYAGLAANVFALSAAFNFFKRAADVDNLARSQQEFAATTGSSLASVTSSLREASGQLLTFQEAASATAVGLAKGFSPQVLENLAEGARKASTALGRDFADSFDRLVRGVSKAEPELLDELGITLRLEDATRRYAASIGKASKDLTTYERSQAVAVETQRQLNELFGDVTPQDNQFIKLATTFDDLLKTVQSGILPVFTALASVINNNFGSAIILFGGLAAAVAKTVLPIDDLKQNLEDTFGNASKAFEQAKDELGGLTDAFKDGQKAQKSAFKGLQNSLKGFEGTSKSIDKILAEYWLEIHLPKLLRI